MKADMNMVRMFRWWMLGVVVSGLLWWGFIYSIGVLVEYVRG